MQYDTRKAQEIGIKRTPVEDLQKREWEFYDMTEPDEKGMIMFKVKTLRNVNPFRPPKHITPIDW